MSIDTAADLHPKVAASKAYAGGWDAVFGTRADKPVTKLSCCIIAKGAPSLELAVASVRPLVDEVVLVWTSADEVRDIAGIDLAEVWLEATAKEDCPPERGCGCKKGDFLDFAAARNRSFELATGSHLFWIDADDVITPSKEGDVDCLRRGCALAPLFFDYQYDFSPDGSPYTVFPTERLVEKGKKTWVNPIHEVMNPAPTEIRVSDMAVVKHKRLDEARVASVARNARIALHWKDDPRYQNDGRFQFYLGQSLKDLASNTPPGPARDKLLTASREAYERSFGLSSFYEERYLAGELVTELLTGEGRYVDALAWSVKAMTAAPHFSQGLLLFGKTLYHLSRDTHHDPGKRQAFARHAIAILERAIGEKQGETILPYKRRVEHEAHIYLNAMYFELGDLEKCLESCDKGLSIGPDHFLEQNRLLCHAYLGQRKLRAAIEELVGPDGAQYKGNELADRIVDEALREVGSYLPTLVKTERKRGPVRKIAFTLGMQWSRWTPKTGAPGGSEIAAVEVTRRLAERGYEVHVYSEPGVSLDEVMQGGVVWHPQGYPASNDEFDAIVGWRSFDRIEPGKSGRRILWMHDMHIDRATPQRVALVDEVVVNTLWHENVVRQQLPSVGNFHVLGAGLTPGKIPFRDDRNPHACFWSSSFDRGLDFMLDLWPRVRAEVDDATLVIAYGFDGSLNMAKKNRDAGKQAEIEALWDRCRSEPGVVLLGDGKRAPEPEYLDALGKSGVWAYPTMPRGNTFGETFCVSAAEAACAGLRIVVTPRAALEEVASPFAFAQVYGDREEESYRSSFAAAIAQAMRAPEDGTRKLLSDKARERFSWDRVVDRWERMLKS